MLGSYFEALLELKHNNNDKYDGIRSTPKYR